MAYGGVLLQEAGLIVMQIKSADKTVGQQAVHDSQFSAVWVVLNAKPVAASFTVPAGQLHMCHNNAVQKQICCCLHKHQVLPGALLMSHNIDESHYC